MFRVALGFAFLWATLDKTFGSAMPPHPPRPGSTAAHPPRGSSAASRSAPSRPPSPQGRDPLANWLFILGLLGIGVALILGIGLRVAAVSGTLMMLGCGRPSGHWPSSPRPVDDHVERPGHGLPPGVRPGADRVGAGLPRPHLGPWQAGAASCRWWRATAGSSDRSSGRPVATSTRAVLVAPRRQQEAVMDAVTQPRSKGVDVSVARMLIASCFHRDLRSPAGCRSARGGWYPDEHPRPPRSRGQRRPALASAFHEVLVGPWRA